MPGDHFTDICLILASARCKSRGAVEKQLVAVMVCLFASNGDLVEPSGTYPSTTVGRIRYEEYDSITVRMSLLITPSCRQFEVVRLNTEHSSGPLVTPPKTTAVERAS
ncbi:Hypothetical protein SMAX5B_001864 [Scophthalmus maximus]|uniref:Uncharacterized protein n=1 Tax=Scophthalmus maximus TaxID=52904 RepID=A0A2U9CWJ8_SCOMX|nr:Hypothetical protein SMAX5B_001864 [Scophthalmus maximus]